MSTIFTQKVFINIIVLLIYVLFNIIELLTNVFLSNKKHLEIIQDAYFLLYFLSSNSSILTPFFFKKLTNS